MTTFGKLDADDISKINGSPEQLESLLMDHYGWSTIHAHAKVDRFMSRISNKS
jgi:uncharacterized protein (DUF2132 family)